MSKEQILALAIQGLTDMRALEVLGDAVLTDDWYDLRMARYNYHKEERIDIAAAPTSRWARAIISILMFDAWGNEPFPLNKDGFTDGMLTDYQQFLKGGPY